jgi:hypothetical protein
MMTQLAKERIEQKKLQGRPKKKGKKEDNLRTGKRSIHQLYRWH